ncbi:hypothetical protein C2G38_2180465 [Gigaspora rosea]|uniref:Uncharacterized protein n=1 Tax=Gigaspora rosea TaxID=44941 RepID=A0A397VDU8_9GLOM|nr:hypothetical protein C2G38_2180465 [Gigaspora rosea]
MDNSFDITNDKAFKEDKIKGATKALIKKAIYTENSQIKSEAEKYVRENYAEYFERFILKDWNIYYVNNIHGPNKLEYGRHFSISSSEDETSKEDRDKSDDNDSENDNTEQGSECKNNSNYSDKV